jgi:phosphoribosylformylglycinamidine synthase
MALKQAGSTLFLVGGFDANLGGSVYADVYGIRDAMLPRIDYERVERELALLAAAYRENLVLGAHDVSDGGLLVAIAKMAFATREGARIGVEVDTFEAWAPEFGIEVHYCSEGCGFVVEVAAVDAGRFVALATQCRVTAMPVAVTIDEYRLRVEPDVELSLDALYETWSAPLRDFYAAAPGGAR